MNRAYVSALRSNGYSVETVGTVYTSGDSDKTLLEIGREHDLVILTNDSDFAALATELEHRGILKYDRYDHTPRDFVRAIDRINRHIPNDAFVNRIEWVENWL